MSMFGDEYLADAKHLSGEQKMVLTLAAAGAIEGATKMLNNAADLKTNYENTPIGEYFREKFSQKRPLEPEPLDNMENYPVGPRERQHLPYKRRAPRMAAQLDSRLGKPMRRHRFRSFPVNENFNEHKVVKRTVLTSSKLMGLSGQNDADVPKYNSGVTLPLEALEFWVGSNVSPRVAHSKGSLALKDKECRIKSMRLRLSNLQILEDRDYEYPNGAVGTTSTNNSEVPAYVIPVESYMGANANGTLCRLFSDNTSVPDDTGDFITTKNIIMGKLVTKSSVDRLNLNPHNFMWSPGDDPIDIEFDNINGAWFIMPELEEGKYHLIPMESGLGNHTTDTYNLPNPIPEAKITSTSSRTETSSTLGSLVLGVPYIVDGSGRPKNYRISFVMEQEITLVSRAEWLQNASAANWNADLAAQLTPRSTQISQFRHMVGPYHFPEDGHKNLQAHHSNE